MSVDNQTVLGPVGFHNIDKKITIEVNRIRICLVSNILRNIFFFCSTEEVKLALEWHEGE